MVPAMHRSTLSNFVHLNLSFSSANDNKNVNRLDALLKMVLDCRKYTKTKLKN